VEPQPNQASLGTAQAALSWRTEGGQQRYEVVEVHDFYEEGIVVQTPEALTTGQTVYLASGQIERRARVHHCEGREDAFVTFLTFEQHDNRREDRLPTIGRATLVCSGPGACSLSVQVTNTSTGGVQVELDQALPVHQMARLSGETYEVLGQLRYCRRRGSKFVVGIQFTRPPYPKGSADFRG